MNALHATYLSRRSPSRLTTVIRTIYAAVALWVISVFAVEFLRSITHIDIPSAAPEFELLFGILYRVAPIVMAILYVPFHLYWAGAAAATAGSVFLKRHGVPADLLSMTSLGMRRFVRSRFFFVCRAYWPYALLNAGMIWALAVCSGFENSRVTYFYLSANRLRIITEISPLLYFPPVAQLMIPAVVALIASLGTLVLVSALGMAAAALSRPQFRFAAGAISRLLIWGAAFGFLMLNQLRRSFDVIGPVIGMFLDSGLSHTGGYLFVTFSSGPPGLPPPVHLVDRTGNPFTPLFYLTACIVLAALILSATVKFLQRR